MKSIAAPVAAAGAGKAQDLLLYRILGYWEALLTALIAAALGTYWFLRNRPRGAQETDASRPTAHMPLWKAALWAGRGGLRRLFDKAPAPARLVEARAAPAETTQPSHTARPKVRFPAWAEKLVAKLSVLKSHLRRKSEKNGRSPGRDRRRSEDRADGEGELDFDIGAPSEAERGVDARLGAGRRGSSPPWDFRGGERRGDRRRFEPTRLSHAQEG